MTSEADETTNISEVWGGIFSWISVRLLVAGLLLFAFVLGCLVGGVGLHDPDTCWLLALGRYIFEQHVLPTTDPFSYTFALEPGKPFVMYQWLSELLFFSFYKLAGLAGLLLFTALILGQSFLVFPLRLAARNMPTSVTILLTMIGTCAACFHFLVRPEVFSYFCIGLLLTLMHRMYSEDHSQKDAWKLVGAFSLLMCLWANLHSAFVLGLILQSLAIICGALEFAKNKQRLASLKTATLSLLFSSLATLLNPKGLELWNYLPGLFFAKFNPRISELRPVRLTDLKEFTFYPFVLLSAFCLIIVLRALWRAYKDKVPLNYFSALIVPISVIVGFSCRRLIPFSVLVMIVQSSLLWGHARLIADSSTLSFGQKVEEGLARMFNPSTWVWPLTVAGLTSIGAYFTFAKVVSPTIPQSSVAFTPPMKALDYLRNHMPTGRVLNDAQYGDMIIWYVPSTKIFIDTRYDMHGENLVSDYVGMISGATNWRQLLDKHEIGWIFVPTKTEIAKLLDHDPEWIKVFADQGAVIVVRRSTKTMQSQPRPTNYSIDEQLLRTQPK